MNRAKLRAVMFVVCRDDYNAFRRWANAHRLDNAAAFRQLLDRAGVAIEPEASRAALGDEAA